MTKIDINKELFKRTSIIKRKKVIENLDPKEFFKLSLESIRKIVKETGDHKKGTRRYRLFLKNKFGNNWNSLFEYISVYSNKVFFGIYVQYSNTDQDIVILASDFLKSGDFIGKVNYYDGTSYTYSTYTYNNSNKSEILRNLCLEYLTNKED